MECKRYKNTYYLVYADGKVFSERAKKFLKPRPDKQGYLRVCFRIDGKSIDKQIHRLVAELFIREPKKDEVVNHLDFNKANNDISNLELVTQKENIQHSIKSGKWDYRKKGWGYKDGKRRWIGVLV